MQCRVIYLTWADGIKNIFNRKFFSKLQDILKLNFQEIVAAPLK